MIDNTRAAYRVLDPSGFYVDDTLHTVDENGDPAELYFDGIPNEQLEPLNELARKRMTEYLEGLDTLAKEASIKLNRPYIGRPRTIDGAIVLATELQRSGMAIMGAKRDETVSEKIEREIPDTGKRGRGRPRKIA